MSQELKNIIEAQIPDNEERLIKPKNVRDTLEAIVDEFDEKTYNFNELDGAVGNTQLSGTYSSASIKTNGSNTVFSMPGTGSVDFQARTVVNLCELRTNLSNTVGALVFVAPNTNKAMFQLEIDAHIFETPGAGRTTKLIVQGYFSGSNWESTNKITIGNREIPVRFALKSNRICVILGNIDSIWRYPHIVISSARFSHNVTDDYCKNWTSEIVTSLSNYTNITDYIPNSVESFLSAEKSKLNGIAAGATVNSSDATLLNRANHTGQQATNTITGLDSFMSYNANINGIAEYGYARQSAGILYHDYITSYPAVDYDARMLVQDQTIHWTASGGFTFNTYTLGSMAFRNVTISESAPSGGADGDVWLQV